MPAHANRIWNAPAIVTTSAISAGPIPGSRRTTAVSTASEIAAPDHSALVPPNSAAKKAMIVAV